MGRLDVYKHNLCIIVIIWVSVGRVFVCLGSQSCTVGVCSILFDPVQRETR